MDLDKLFFEADKLYNDYRLEEAFALFMKIAEAGHVSAMNRVALMYSLGEGIGLDYEKSIEWDNRAIENGATSSLLNKAITYRMMGRITEYKYWLEKALDEGDSEAALLLAQMYMISDKEKDNIIKYLKIVIDNEDACEDSKEEARGLLLKIE